MARRCDGSFAYQRICPFVHLRAANVLEHLRVNALALEIGKGYMHEDKGNLGKDLWLKVKREGTNLVKHWCDEEMSRVPSLW